ncbi:hypothetical protein ACEPAG_4362 [Sanghuangporus baumii]
MLQRIVAGLLFVFVLFSQPADSQKAGLAWPNGNFNDIRQYTSTGKVSWYYTWSPNPVRSDLEFVSMLWGRDQIDTFTSMINGTISRNGVTHILGFNEPQQPGQSNLTAEEGAQLWRTYLEPLKSQGIRLGTPAPSGAPSGKTWLQDWLTACAGGCNPDFVALHWYDVNATQFQLYLEDFHDTFQLPIWVTEWADHNFNGDDQPSFEEVVAFLNQTQGFMDATDWIERYAWFGVMENMQDVGYNNAMMDSRGDITDLGRQYIGGGSAEGGSAPSAISSASSRKFRTQFSVFLPRISSVIMTLTVFPSLLQELIFL